MKQLDRFLRLERVRKDSEQELPAAASRFSTLEQAPTLTSVPQHVTANLERFRPEVAPEPELELEPRDADEPFVRCMRCGADSVRHATVCRQCEARLDSEEVRAFNSRLWAEMTAAREREAEQLREFEAVRRGGTPVTAGGAEQAMVDELAARADALHAPETPSQWGLWGSWRFSNARLSVPQILIAVALGLPALVALYRRGAVGSWLVLLVALGALVAVAARRRR